MEFKEYIEKYDNLEAKQLAEIEISDSLRKEDLTGDLQYEKMAMAFGEDCSHRYPQWNRYYGPGTAITFADKGDIHKAITIYNVKPDDVTYDAVEYWDKRRKQSINPIFKARYSGLVYEYGKQFGFKVDRQIIEDYVIALLDSVMGGYVKYDIFSKTKLLRALSISIKSKNSILQTKSIKAIIDFFSHIEPKAIGVWGNLYKGAIDNKSTFTEEELNIFRSIANKKFKSLQEEGDPWAVCDVASVFLESSTQEERKGVLSAVQSCFDRSLPEASAMQAMGMLEHMSDLYKKYNFVEDSQIQLQRITKIRESLMEEIEVKTFSAPLDRKQYIGQLHDIFEINNTIDPLTCIVLHFIVDKNQNEEHIKDLAKRMPLAFMIPTQIFDEKGRPLSVIRGIEDDMEGQVVLLMSKKFEINSIFLTIAFQELSQMGQFTPEYLKSYYRKSPAFEEDRHVAIDRIIDLYFQKDYFAFCHLILPQIENAIRNIFEHGGGVAIKPQSSKIGYTLKTLDVLLREDILKKILSESFCKHLQVLLTDQRGWNIRNRICHGNLVPDQIGQLIADWLMHAFLLISLVR